MCECVSVGATLLKQQPHLSFLPLSIPLVLLLYPPHPPLLLLLPSHPPCLLLLLLIVPSLSLSSCASLSEYGPHRLPISLVCRRLQRLLQLADPPGRGPRAAPLPSAAAERQAQRPSTVGAAAETQPRTGYPPLRAPQPCSTSFRRAYLLPSPCYPSPLCRRGRHVRMSLETAAERHAPARTDH